MAAPVNGPPKSTPIVIVRPIASPATTLNWLRASTAAPKITNTRKNVRIASSQKAGAGIHAVAERRHAEFDASVAARGSSCLTSSAASAAPPN